MEISMSAMEFKAQDEPALGPNVRRYSIACAHGASSAVLLPGRKPVTDVVVLDLMLAGHHRRQRCQCLPAIPALTADARAWSAPVGARSFPGRSQ
jgi:hypothetical protein